MLVMHNSAEYLVMLNNERRLLPFRRHVATTNLLSCFWCKFKGSTALKFIHIHICIWMEAFVACVVAALQHFVSSSLDSGLPKASATKRG